MLLMFSRNYTFLESVIFTLAYSIALLLNLAEVKNLRAESARHYMKRNSDCPQSLQMSII